MENLLTKKIGESMSDEFTYDEETHTYKLSGIVIPSVTQAMKQAGLINLDWIDPQLLQEKSDLGKKVHTATELFDSEDLFINELHPLLRQYLDSWIKFRSDYSFEVKEIEFGTYHKVYRYAGRLDRIGIIKNQLTLVDIKSGTIQETHAIQTAGYELLYNQDRKISDRIRKRYCVYLSPEGYKVIEHKNPTDTQVFLAALTITNYLRRIS